MKFSHSALLVVSALTSFTVNADYQSITDLRSRVEGENSKQSHRELQGLFDELPCPSVGLRDPVDIIEEFCTTGNLDVYFGRPTTPPPTEPPLMMSLSGKKGGILEPPPVEEECNCFASLYALSVAERVCVRTDLFDSSDFRGYGRDVDFGEYYKCDSRIKSPCGDFSRDTDVGTFNSETSVTFIESCCEPDGLADDPMPMPGMCIRAGAARETGNLSFFSNEDPIGISFTTNANTVYEPGESILGSSSSAAFATGIGFSEGLSGATIFLGVFCNGNDGTRRQLQQGSSRKLIGKDRTDALASCDGELFELYAYTICQGGFGPCALDPIEFLRLSVPPCEFPFEPYTCDE